MGQSASKPCPEDMRVGKPEPYALGKDFDDFTFEGYAGTLDLAYPALLKTARQSPDSGDGDCTTPTAVCNLAVPTHDCHTEMSTESGEKTGNNGFRIEAYRQLCLMYGTSDQEGSTGLFVQIMT